jgi:sirohydrochlorin ferrochelatase
MSPSPLTGTQKTGVLVVAHGDRRDDWNEGVRRVIAPLRDRYVVELAFLYPVPGESLQEGIDRLEAQGVDTILAIPLLASSYSEHFEELEYVLGLRDTVSSVTEAHTPVDVKTPIRLGRAIDSSPTVAKILERRAGKLSIDPPREALVLVGHGPNSEDYNRHWLRHMDTMGSAIQRELGFRRTHSRTLRDDAPPDIREAASRALRLVVERESRDGSVLIVTLLISHGEVQSGIKERLKGLTYSIADEGLATDPMIGIWVEEEIRRLMSGQST